MKKIVVVLAALVPLASASLAHAQSDVAAARVNPDPDAVRAYWTPARMANAIPRGAVQLGGPANPAAPGGHGGGGGGGGGTPSPSTALKVSWPAAPDVTYTNGKVFFHDGNFDYVCSGTAVSSTTGDVVWTAGHCVNDGGQNTWVTSWSFVPAYNSGTSFPSPTFVATHLYTSMSWANTGEFGNDFGAAYVANDPNTGNTLAQTIGFSRRMSFTPNFSTGSGHVIHAFGYPAEGKFNGQSLYRCDTYVSQIDTSASPSDMGIPCELNGGSSGGAWVDANGNQVSNNSYTYRGLKNVMFGPTYASTANNVLSAADQKSSSGTTHN